MPHKTRRKLQVLIGITAIILVGVFRLGVSGRATGADAEGCGGSEVDSGDEGGELPAADGAAEEPRAAELETQGSAARGLSLRAPPLYGIDFGAEDATSAR